MKLCQKIILHEPQRNRNATANYVNLIMTSTVPTFIFIEFIEYMYILRQAGL